MRKAEEYRWLAHEADRQAKAALSNSARAEFAKIANNWRDLARQAEELDQTHRDQSSPEDERR